MRSATITGALASTSQRAASASAALSPCAGIERASFGIFKAWSWIGSSCSSISAITSTGSIGGVIAILYARTVDSAKCCSEPGASSHLTKSRTIAAASCTEWFHSVPGRRLLASMPLPAIIRIGTRSTQAL